MNCMNCGKPTVGNAVLCRECARAARQHAPRRSTVALIVALSAVSALAIGLIIYLTVSANSRAAAIAQLRVQQENLNRREYQLSQAEGRNEALTAQLAQKQAENDSLRQQINELDSQIGAADSNRNQSTSNYIQQIAELEQQVRQLQSEQAAREEELQALLQTNETLTEDNKTLTDDLDALNEDYEALQDKLDELQDRYDLLASNYHGNSDPAASAQYLEYKKKADFLDSYIVFVQKDDTGHYHTYDCSHFTSQEFWAYNRSLAKSQGYTPCPYCNGGN